MNEPLKHAPVGVIETTTDGVITDLNERAAETIGTSREAAMGTDIRETFPRSATGTIREAFADEGPTERSFEEYYPRRERWLAVDVHVGDSVVVYVRDRTDRRESERTLDRLEQRLDRVRQIDGLIVAVLGSLVSASDRTEVAETVASRLGGTDPYTFAWVGDRDFPADRLRVLAAAGDAPDLRAGIDDHLGTGEGLPEQAAVAAGETQLVDAIADDETVPQGIRHAAFGHGLQSALAVPLEYQGTVHGVVSVYSRQEGGFSEQERVGLETLGSVAGFAIHAIRQEGLLVTDTVTEVTLEARDDRIPFVSVARERDVRLSLDGVVPRGDGSVVCYLAVDGSADGATAEPAAERADGTTEEPTDGTTEEPTDGTTEEHTDGTTEERTDDPIVCLDEALSAHEGITDVRWIHEENDPLLQATVTGETPVTTLTAWGATVSSAEYDGESARIVAEAPPDEEVRRLVEAVDATVAETDLLATSETARTQEGAEAFRNALAERLTEKQRTVLRTASLSGYFESPRDSTAEEVAETLDITGPTLLYHLRRAQRKLVASFLETDPGTDIS